MPDLPRLSKQARVSPILAALKASSPASSRDEALSLMDRIFRMLEDEHSSVPHDLSQADLATRFGIQQAAVSKFERRQDLHLATIVKALGGTLEMKVKFPGSEVPLKMAKVTLLTEPMLQTVHPASIFLGPIAKSLLDYAYNVLFILRSHSRQ